MIKTNIKTRIFVMCMFSLSMVGTMYTQITSNFGSKLEVGHAAPTVTYLTSQGTMQRVFLTSGSTWAVPANFNSTNNTIEVIGGGAGGYAKTAGAIGAYGGGGAGYAKKINVTLTPSSTVDIQVGTGGLGGPYPFGGGNAGTESWVKNNGGTKVVEASGGTYAAPGAGVIGDVLFTGGNAGGNSGGYGGGGGGGAAGPLGKGGDAETSNTGGGGGGNGGGSAGLSGNGGNNASATGGGTFGTATVAGTNGTDGGGGGGGEGNGAADATGVLAGNGSTGSEWDATHGSGGGGGGAGGSDAGGGSFGVGGNGGTGAGGGGGGFSNTAGGGGASGNGGNGIIVVTWYTQTTWTVPADWNNANNSIEVIGGGAGGTSKISYNNAVGGGGGAYSKITNVTLTPSSTIDYTVGVAGAGEKTVLNPAAQPGGDSWLKNNSNTTIVLAKGGSVGIGNTGGVGGLASAGTGTLKYNGGNGGDDVAQVDNFAGTGGGGAAGPLGVGGKGGDSDVGNFNAGAGGGGGNGGGSNGSSSILVNGGNGGNNAGASGGGTGATVSVSGQNGTNGGGGGGGGGNDTPGSDATGVIAGNGGNGTEWDATHGSGGGGGGGGGSDNGPFAGTGGNGGLYGGGGGGAGLSNLIGNQHTVNAGNGGGGMIVITYEPPQPGITIVQSGGTTAVTEGGATDSFTVVLDAQPATDVVLNVSSNDTSSATVSASTLTFTNANWNSTQTITVTAPEDADVVSESPVVTISVNDATSDNAYDPVADQTVNVTVTDNDTAGFSIVQSGGTTAVTEGGATDSFTVVLTAQPTTDVVFNVTSNDTTSATVSASTLTFTNANWNSTQTITVTAPEDADIINETPVITVSVNDATSDNAWDPLADQTVNVAVTDNDSAGFSIVQSGGTTAVTEGGATDSFTVVLTAQPTTDVVFNVTSNDTTSATVSASTLTFTNANWNSTQTITVTAPEDADIINETPVITVSVNDATSDNAWDPLADQTVNVAVTDNDTAGFSIVQSGGTTAVTEGGATDSFTVVLTAQPTTDVVFNVSSNDTTSATVSSATLTFTNANWNSTQTITVTAPEDADAVNETPVITVSVNDATSDNAWDPLTDQTVNVAVTDNDTANVTIVQSGGTTAVTEGGATDSFTAVLTAQPATDVVLNVSSNDTTSATVSAATLTFTNANWNTTQTITITAPEDADVVSESPIITIAVNDASSDDTFDPVTDKTVNVAVTDNDTAGFSIVQSGGTTAVTEGGATDSFTVVLTAQPTTDVVFNISSNDTTSATVSAATLTFTNGNWDTPQTITVTAPQDADIISETPVVTVSVNDATSDNAWDPLADQTVNVAVTDNDSAGFSIVQSGGTTAVTEGGATDSFTVVLTAQPATNVVFNISSNDTTSATVSSATLTFTNGNWDTTQAITVTAPEDADAVNETPVVTVSVNDATSDNAWDPLADQTVNVAVSDNDTANITIVQSGGTTAVTEGGATDSFTAVLTAQPATDVVLNVSSNDTTSATVSSATLTFTNANWNTTQTITVTAPEDADIVSETPIITIAVNDATSDDVFDPVTDKTVNVAVTDNDTAGFSIVQSGGTTAVTEGGATDSFTVVLTAQPATDVVFNVSSNDTTSATVSAATLTFTNGNWDTPQTITVTAPQDADVVSETPVITIAVNDGSSDDIFDPVTDKTVNVTVTDNDTAGFSIVQSGGTTAVTEGGATDSFTVVLTAQPATNVVFNISSNDTTSATVSAATLTFTNGNWDTPQTITVTAPEDADIISETPVITVSVNDASSDNAWDPLADQTVNVTVTDNDTANISIVESGGTTAVTEGGATDSFTAVLTVQPTTDVVLNVSSNDTTSATVSAAMLTFTNGNWDTPQTITVTAPEDVDLISETPIVTISVDDAASDDAFDPISDKTVNVTVTDNDSVVPPAPTPVVNTGIGGGGGFTEGVTYIVPKIISTTVENTNTTTSPITTSPTITTIENVRPAPISEWQCAAGGITLERKYPFGGFADIDGHWAKDYLNTMRSYGLFNEFQKNNNISPNSTVSRAEFTQLLLLALCYPIDPASSVKENPFPDVQKYTSYARYIQTAKRLGFITGYLPYIADGRYILAGDRFYKKMSNGTILYLTNDIQDVIRSQIVFLPNDTIKRAEVIKMIFDATKENMYTKFISSYPDVKLQEWYTPYINRATEIGLINGYKDGTFQPHGSITRAELAKIFVKYFLERK